MLLHIGFDWTQNIDGSGDKGADLVGAYRGEKIVVQSKWKKTQPMAAHGVREASNALDAYRADRAIVVTNGDFANAAREEATDLFKSQGKRIDLLNGAELLSSWPRLSSYLPSKHELRPYQIQAIDALTQSLKESHRALLVLATGLGKTVVAGRLIDRFLQRRPDTQVLVLAHTRELVMQLERALWSSLSKEVPTQVLDGESKPNLLAGVTVATHQSAIEYVRSGYRPTLVVIDEAHNVGPDSEYSEILAMCASSDVVGLTATPWRTDKFSIEEFFGKPSFQMGLVEGINGGYLSEVNYRMFTDNIDWENIQALSRHSYTISELNRKLFLPQRDEKIRDKLLETWATTVNPRAIVFCQTIEHAERLASVLQGNPAWKGTSALHAKQSMRDRKLMLLGFRSGEIPILTAVDILNEGVDVPDVNIVCFARITHSRKIFVQQLGRGLRLAAGKSHVEVLDFVSDIRRLKAAMDLKREMVGDRGSEVLFVPGASGIDFSEADGAGQTLQAWLRSAADLDDLDDTAVLSVPDL
jgi:superfamily II DNA or RNA helicase